jgi:hypothetical protein
MDLQQLVTDFATGMQLADSRLPQARSARSQAVYQPGIGPHTESQTVALVMRALEQTRPDAYTRAYALEQPYPTTTRAKVDICFGASPGWALSVEVKMLRLMGDNGKPNDNILMHILSPYPAHRSAVTDVEKLARSGLPGRKAIVIYAYEYEGWPSLPAIEAFELLAGRRARLRGTTSAAANGLVHPVHRRATVYGWAIEGSLDT